jgi:short-subunit dehydrogenase
MRNFHNKLVVITGATGGLGRALSTAFGSSGARIAGVDIPGSPFSEVQSHLQSKGISFHRYECDVRHLEDVKRSAEKIFSELGEIDILINNAGISHLGRFSQTQVDVIHRVMDVNFFGSVYWTKFTLESIIRQKGMIIGISSVAGFSPLVGRCGYAASKYALHGFLESLRTEVEEFGVKVMMVSPAFIATEINRSALGPEGKQAKQNRLHIGKKLTPEYVASKILQGAMREKRHICIGRTAYIAYYLQKFFPSLLDRLMLWKLKGELEEK